VQGNLFQYRIIHRIRPGNVWLYVRKAVNTNNWQYVHCTNNNLDVISHYLVRCPPVSRYWESFVTWWNSLTNSLKYSNLKPSVEDSISLGFPAETNEDIIFNYCLIVDKYYIYILFLKKSKVNLWLIPGYFKKQTWGKNMHPVM